MFVAKKFEDPDLLPQNHSTFIGNGAALIGLVKAKTNNGQGIEWVPEGLCLTGIIPCIMHRAMHWCVWRARGICWQKGERRGCDIGASLAMNMLASVKIVA